MVEPNAEVINKSQIGPGGWRECDQHGPVYPDFEKRRHPNEAQVYILDVCPFCHKTIDAEYRMFQVIVRTPNIYAPLVEGGPKPAEQPETEIK